MIAALSLIWGASFMFIRVADREIDPFALVWLRVLLGCAVLVPVLLFSRGRDGLRQAGAAWWALILLGAVNTAAPFALFSWAETRIDSSLAAILQAAAPIFTVLLAVRFGGERIGGARLVGILLGAAGVALLVGAPGGGNLVAALAVVLAAFCYACGATFTSKVLKGVDPLVIGAGSCAAAMIITAPLGIARLPDTMPGWKETGSVVTLGLVGTGVAYIILFALLKSAGPSRTILVTYTIPGVAVLYGALLLGEPLTVASIAGLALILGGVFLAGRTTARAREANRKWDASKRSLRANSNREGTTDHA
jgi:drug/metabolite transporter (DMT)-like permease